MRRLPLLLLFPLILCACREEERGASSCGNTGHTQLPLSAQCAACHAGEAQAWQSSHHAHAWRRLSPRQDAEPFSGQTLRARGSELRFLRTAEGAPMVQDDETGEAYAVRAAIGHSPLVQYLVEGERGALQCLSAAWDTNRREWFDTMAQGEERRRGDWGHWLGRGMTWNTQCAACHVSGFEKRHDAAADAYASRWQEPGVTCIQCHSLADTPTEASGRPIRRNKGKQVTRQQQNDSCATCHARREELRPGFREGDVFEDYFRLELPLVKGVFWPNGMQRDECYTETGMRLSPMGRAGVSCMDCHDAHSGHLRLPQEDNSLCLRCHGRGERVNGTAAPRITLSTHTPCPPGSTGARCVECHMPESVFMARDARRDHAFTSPDPALSEELGIPNACTQCHSGKSDAWAAAAVEKTYGHTLKMAAYRPRTRAVAAAMRGEGDTGELLAAYRAEVNPTWQATLLELLARQEPTEAIRQAAREAAHAEAPLLRAAAARVLGEEAPQLLQDPIRLVRHAAAWAQLPSLLAQESPHPALIELEETLRHQADHPAGQMQLSSLAQARARLARSRGDTAAAAEYEAAAESCLRRALELDPASAAARMDFAVFLARAARPLEALEQMLACTAAHPGNAEAQYRLALILHELGHAAPARRALEKALQLSPQHERARRALKELNTPPHSTSAP